MSSEMFEASEHCRVSLTFTFDDCVRVRLVLLARYANRDFATIAFRLPTATNYELTNSSRACSQGNPRIVPFSLPSSSTKARLPRRALYLFLRASRFVVLHRYLCRPCVHWGIITEHWSIEHIHTGANA